MLSNRGLRARKESYWREQVAKWHDSGLSQAEFCRRAGLSSRALGYWKHRLAQAHSPGEPNRTSQAVVAVRMAPATEPSPARQPIIVHVHNSVRLEIPDGFQPNTLEQVLRVLGRL